mgnify:CR=1 FL=1
MPRISTLRLSLLRACYAVLFIGLSLRYGPVIMDGLANQPRMDGVVVALLGAVGLLSIVGFFSPIRMLPLLVFEISWKLIWVSAVALPKWLDGSLDEGTLSILINCAVALPFIAVVPWRYVAVTFLRGGEPFRAAVTADGSATR